MNWFFGKSQTQNKRRRNGRTALGVEQLEGRDLCAVDMHLDGVTLVVDTSTEQQGVTTTFTLLEGDKNDPYDDKVQVEVKQANGAVTKKSFDVYGLQRQGDNVVRVKQIQMIYAYGGKGNDTFKNNTAIDSQMQGGEGDDTLSGGSGKDILYGNKGSDHLYGNDGYDYLYAFEGGGHDETAIDYLFGGKEADSLYGGAWGVNYLYGEGGNDRIQGGVKALNFEYGGEGIDWLFGGKDGATNHMFGGAGNDFMTGGSSEFGKPKTMNIMTDDEGSDLFLGGSRAMNYMFAGDGSGYASQKDTIVPGEFSSYDYWTSDNNDVIWNPAWGVYPNKPK